MQLEIYSSKTNFLFGFLFVVDKNSFILIELDENGTHYFISFPDQLRILLDWFISISKKIQLETLLTHENQEIRRLGNNLITDQEGFLNGLFTKFQKVKSKSDLY